MTNRKLILTTALLLALVPATAMAQDMTINGAEVPQAQQAEVQEWCDELVAQQGATGTQTPESTMTETPDAEASTATSATSTESDNAPVALDVQTITLDMCQQGGFAAATAQ